MFSMAFIRAKTFYNKNGTSRTYYYLVKNYRSEDSKTPKQAVIEYLGTYEKIPSKTLLIAKYPHLKQEFDAYFNKKMKRASKSLDKAKIELEKAKKTLKE